MIRCPQWLAPLAATAAMLVSAPCAAVSAYTYQLALAGGGYFNDDGVQINTSSGQFFPTSDGSTYRFVVCVGSEPGQPGCSVPGGPPPPPTTWYEWPDLPSSAAAQAHTPDYGIMRARAWSSGTSGVGTGAPGYTSYVGGVNAGWHDEINTTSTVPVVITFVVSLQGNWTNSGVFAFQMGRPGRYDPDLGYAEMDGRTWANCTNCFLSSFNTGAAYTVLPGGANGSVDQIVTFDFTVNPDSFADPEDPNPYTNPFDALLSVYAFNNDSEVDAYSTVTLQTILVPPNAGLSFASGHAYNVTVVPEPAAWALWAFGLAGVAFAKRGRRRDTAEAT